MSFNVGDRVQVIKINFTHTKRQIVPLPITQGKKGTISKLASVEDNAYYVMLDGMDKSIHFYQDELTNI
jgi:ribosomal protein L21E